MEKQPEVPKNDVPNQSSTTESVSHEPRNFLVSFLLTLLAGPLGLRHFYLGDTKLGWIRTGLFAGGYVWIFLMALLQQGTLAALGFLAVSVAMVWAVVDFFYVYNAVKTDADGQPVVATARDQKWAKVIYLTTIIAFVAAFVLAIAGVSLAENSFKNEYINGHVDSNTPEGTNFDPEEFIRQMEAKSESQSF